MHLTDGFTSRLDHARGVFKLPIAAGRRSAGQVNRRSNVGPLLQGGARQIQSGGLGQSIWWLSREGVQKELGLVDGQRKNLEAIRADMLKKMREIYPSLRDLPQEKRRTKYAELRKGLNEQTEQRVNDVLLPQQRDRLKQVILQTRLRQGTSVYMLTGDELAKDPKDSSLKSRDPGPERVPTGNKLRLDGRAGADLFSFIGSWALTASGSLCAVAACRSPPASFSVSRAARG